MLRAGREIYCGESETISYLFYNCAYLKIIWSRIFK